MILTERSPRGTVGAMLPKRQQQTLDELRALGGRADAPTIAKAMWMHYNLPVGQTYDLLGAMQRKGVIRLDRRTEATVDWKGVTHAKQIAEWVEER